MTGPADEGGTGRLTRALQRLAAARRPSRSVQRLLLVVAATAFVVGSVVAWRALGLGLDDIDPLPIAVVLVVLVPATIALNAAELRVMARLLEGRLSLRPALRVVVIATAANLLPVPGAAAVRIQALRTAGSTLGPATVVNIGAAVLWAGIGVLVAGAGLALDDPAAGIAAVVIGAAGVAVGTTVAARAARSGGVGRLVAVEAALVAVLALRLWLVLEAVGVAVSLRQAAVIASSAPLAAAAGVFPSGLGLAEGIATAAAPLIALPAAAGFTATALNRILGLAVTAPLALALGGRDDGESADDD